MPKIPEIPEIPEIPRYRGCWDVGGNSRNAKNTRIVYNHTRGVISAQNFIELLLETEVESSNEMKFWALITSLECGSMLYPLKNPGYRKIIPSGVTGNNHKRVILL